MAEKKMKMKAKKKMKVKDKDIIPGNGKKMMKKKMMKSK